MVSSTSGIAASLPYHEPGIVAILILCSFLLLLNAVSAILDKLLYCGLLGQVLVGIAWGTPGAKWLSQDVESAVVQLGYLGLILLVYEGGLSTSFQSLKANLLLSCGVALTGIVVPIGLSYTLQGLLDATPLQAFAAGAALCSTSLGTTFTVLGTSGLSTSRLGVVLTSAAIMDDVVGLVMVQVISNLGSDNFSWVTVVRPVFVSIAFALLIPVFCLLVLKPATLALNRFREGYPEGRVNRVLLQRHSAFVLHTALLICLVTGATYAGTSNLLAAYIAGATVSWWDSEVPHVVFPRSLPEPPQQNPPLPPDASVQTPAEKQAAEENTANEASSHPPIAQSEHNTATPPGQAPTTSTANSGTTIYHHYYHPAVSTILQPLFFASIGFSIPITRMFRSAIVWRGIIYTLLMALGKFVCGFWLVKFSITSHFTKPTRFSAKIRLPALRHCFGKTERTSPNAKSENKSTPTSSHETHSSPNPPKPFSLHPPIIIALAMCARGEIGFLISGVAEAKGIFARGNNASGGPSDIFLVVTWAIVLCTIIGPFGVGLAVRRVKALEKRKNEQHGGAGREVLGVWGLE